METAAYYLFHAFAAHGYLTVSYPCYGFGYYQLFCSRARDVDICNAVFYLFSNFGLTVGTPLKLVSDYSIGRIPWIRIPYPCYGFGY